MKKQWNSLTDSEKKNRTDKWIKAGHKASIIKTQGTSIELKVEDQLKEYGVKYIKQKPINEGHFILDFYLPDYQLVIECNGDYWHSLEKAKVRDRSLEEYVLSKGKDILWLWEHEIKDEWFDISDYIEI